MSEVFLFTTPSSFRGIIRKSGLKQANQMVSMCVPRLRSLLLIDFEVLQNTIGLCWILVLPARKFSQLSTSPTMTWEISWLILLVSIKKNPARRKRAKFINRSDRNWLGPEKSHSHKCESTLPETPSYSYTPSKHIPQSYPKWLLTLIALKGTKHQLIRTHVHSLIGSLLCKRRLWSHSPVASRLACVCVDPNAWRFFLTFWFSGFVLISGSSHFFFFFVQCFQLSFSAALTKHYYLSLQHIQYIQSRISLCRNTGLFDSFFFLNLTLTERICLSCTVVICPCLIWSNAGWFLLPQHITR